MGKWCDRFMEMAEMVASFSKDPSTKVGCVLVSDKRVVLGTGFNGFPRGFPDDENFLNNRTQKHKFVLHAEENAILNASTPVGGLLGCTAFVTLKPCSHCMAMLAQVGVGKVVYKKPSKEIAERYKDSFAAADLIMEECGIIKMEV